jgi:hypothetical protein
MGESQGYINKMREKKNLDINTEEGKSHGYNEHKRNYHEYK